MGLQFAIAWIVPLIFLAIWIHTWSVIRQSRGLPPRRARAAALISTPRRRVARVGITLKRWMVLIAVVALLIAAFTKSRKQMLATQAKFHSQEEKQLRADGFDSIPSGKALIDYHSRMKKAFQSAGMFSRWPSEPPPSPILPRLIQAPTPLEDPESVGPVSNGENAEKKED